MNTQQTPNSTHGQPAPPPATPPGQYTDGFGIASIIMAALFLSIPGIILGIIGEFKAKSHRASPVLSRIGLISNLLMLLFSIVMGVIIFSLVMNNAEFKTAFTENVKTELTQQVFETDTFSVHAPRSFADTSIDYPDVDLSLADSTNDVYLHAYAFPASDIADDTTLEQFADNQYQAFVNDTNFTLQNREKLASGTIANPHGLEVLDYKMQANAGINKFVYYDRYVKTSKGYYMLTSWTTPGKLASNLPAMKSTLASFSETAN